MTGDSWSVTATKDGKEGMLSPEEKRTSVYPDACASTREHGVYELALLREEIFPRRLLASS